MLECRVWVYQLHESMQPSAERCQDFMAALQAGRNRSAANLNPIIEDSLKRQIEQLKGEVATINKAIEAQVLDHAQAHSCGLRRAQT